MSDWWARAGVLIAAIGMPLACSANDPSGTSETIPVPDPTTSTTSTTEPAEPADPDEPADPAAPVSTTSSPATSTTAVPTTTAPESDPELAALYRTAAPSVADDVVCQPAWSELTRPEGVVTFARDGSLFDFDPSTGTLRCLAELDRTPMSLDWNPAGNRLLVDEDLIVTEDGRQASGFAPGTLGISWSLPEGTALIAPATDGSALRHISASDPTDEIDVGSLAITWTAAYHPSGLAIVSAGIDESGVPGLFLSDNRGLQTRVLVFLEDPATTITEVAFSHDGESVVFVHDHTAGTVDEGVLAHVHRLHLTGLWIEDLAALTDVVPTNLIASEQADGTIAWVETRSATNDQTFAWNGEPVRLGFPETATEPVGIFDDGTTAAVVRPLDGGDEGQLWLFPPDRDPMLVASGVSAAATRTVHDPTWTDPPLDIEQQAVG